MLALILLLGCSTPSPSTGRAASGTVLVIPAGAPEHLSYLTPLEKNEALQKGLQDGASAAVNPAGLFVLPLTMGIGAAQGLRGKTAERIETAEHALTNAAASLHFDQRLCEALVELGPRMTGHRWTLHSEAWGPSNANLRAERGGETSLILLVQLPSIGLEPVAPSGDAAVNPTLRFRAEVRCWAANLATGERFETFRFGGGLHKFLTWAEDDAVRVRAQAARGVKALAEQIIRKLFAMDDHMEKNEPALTSPQTS